MVRICLATALALIAHVSLSQMDLIGTTLWGGTNQGGVVFQIGDDGSNYQIIGEPEFFGGHYPAGNQMVEGPTGKIVGSTRNGNNGRPIFEYDPVAGDYNVLSNLGANSIPQLSGPTFQMEMLPGSVLLATSEGYGAFGGGAIYEFDVATQAINIVHSFDPATEGSYPRTGVFLASNGKYYGGNQYDGLNGSGTFWEYDPVGGSLNVINHFATTDGRWPHGNLVELGGKIYGLTWQGGTGLYGVIYSYDLATATFSIEHNNSIQSQIQHGMTVGPDGNLYGTSSWGGANLDGYIYQYNPVTGTRTVVHDFLAATDGEGASAELTLHGGIFYGSCSYGGSNDLGTFFSYDPIADVFSLIHDCDGSLGTRPTDKMMLHSNGKLYGFCSGNPTYDDGAVVSYDPVSGILANEFFLATGPAGGNPVGEFASSGNGKLYTHMLKGDQGRGALAEFDYNTGQFAMCIDYTGQNGTYPYGGVTIGPSGVVYACVGGGGNNGEGVLSSYDPATAVATTLHHFEWTTGSYAEHAPTEHNGKLYGTASYGGALGQGVIYEYDLTSSTYTVLHDLDYADNDYSTCSPLFVGDVMYMSSQWGGFGYGTIYSYDTSTGTYTLIHTFDGTIAYTPSNSMILGSDGHLYGRAMDGGANGYGGIYRLDISTNTVTEIFSFDATLGGWEQQGALLEIDPGVFYGTSTGTGGTFGLIYEVDLNTATSSVLHNFNGDDGYYPLSSLIAVQGCDDNDGDGVCNDDDNCPDDSNADQQDTDGDGLGDACDIEECDGLDNDGDGEVDEGFDSDSDGLADCFDTEECDGLDNDGDGEIDEGFDADGDGLADCFDTEECDGLDNDGDGEVDEGFDSDGDGTSDCFDTEECDGLDNDGDGLIDDDDPSVTGQSTWYADEDEDGYGTPDDSIVSCSQPGGYVDNADDCDDGDENINPGMVEIPCDGKDNDCNAATTDGGSTGCTDSTACNFDSAAQCDDSSCVYATGCETCSGETDGTGVVSDNDADDDGVCDLDDNCPNDANPGQEDIDNDGDGDVCDDSDGDGLTDDEELTIGTEWNNPDTDADGVNDGDEVNTWGTQPLIQDSDDDGLTDGAEINTTGTDPLDEDTDDDLCLDLTDVMGQCGNECIGDFDFNGEVNTADLLIMLGVFGNICP